MTELPASVMQEESVGFGKREEEQQQVTSVSSDKNYIEHTGVYEGTDVIKWFSGDWLLSQDSPEIEVVSLSPKEQQTQPPTLQERFFCLVFFF